MKPKRRRLLELAGIVHRTDTKLLLEKKEEEAVDDIFAADEEEDKGGDDDDDDKGDDAGGDKGADEEAEASEKKEEDDKKEEIDPVEELTPSQIAKYGDGEIDVTINGFLEDIYTRSIEQARVKSVTSLSYPGKVKSLEIDAVKKESKYSLQRLLLEEDVPAEEFDMGFYAGEIARYIKNYDTLLDMEGMIFNKARQMLLNQLGSEAEQEFIELLVRVHGINFTDRQGDPDLTGASQPVAVGATPGGGG